MKPHIKKMGRTYWQCRSGKGRAMRTGIGLSWREAYEQWENAQP